MNVKEQCRDAKLHRQSGGRTASRTNHGNIRLLNPFDKTDVASMDICELGQLFLVQRHGQAI
jgi:hypothetical protein